MPDVVRLRLSRSAVKKLFSTKRASISKGLEDVLEEFLRERR